MAEGRRCAPDRVVVINDRSTAVGGASKLARDLALGLERAGMPVTFLAGDSAHGDAPARDTIFLDQTPLLEERAMVAATRGLYNRPAAQALGRLIAERDTPRTIYHLHGWSKILSPSIFGALAPVRARTVLHAHDFFLACPNGGFLNYRTQQVCGLTPMSAACILCACDKRSRADKLWRVARHQLRQMLFPLAGRPAHIVMIHERMAPYFARAAIGPDSLCTVRNPAIPYLDQPARPWLSQRMMFIGRVEPEKGYALAAASARAAGVALHVIGTGSGMDLLRRQYPEVTLHGWKRPAEIAALIDDCRALVVASPVPEPYGLVIAEAIGSGIPVILPDNALLAAEITAGNCGIAYRAGDAASLVAAMQRIASDDALTRTLGANACAAASTLANTPAKWLGAMEQVYARLLKTEESAVTTPI